VTVQTSRAIETICDSLQSSTFSKERERSDYLFWRCSAGVPDDNLDFGMVLNKAIMLSNGSELLSVPRERSAAIALVSPDDSKSIG
jgi:hypothetical protein